MKPNYAQLGAIRMQDLGRTCNQLMIDVNLPNALFSVHVDSKPLKNIRNTYAFDNILTRFHLEFKVPNKQCEPEIHKPEILQPGESIEVCGSIKTHL